MEFAVGDKVMCPNRGCGTIVAVEHRELVDGFEHYYVIEIHSQRFTLRVPMHKMEALGIRLVMSPKGLDQVWDTLKERPHRLSDDFKVRQEQIRQKLRSGQPLEIAEAVRDLAWREQYAYLTKADAELLARGRNLLADEVALVLDMAIVEAERMIDEALAANFAFGSQ